MHNVLSKPKIIDPDRLTRRNLAKSKSSHFEIKTEVNGVISPANNLFLVLAGSSLSERTDFIAGLLSQSYPKVIFVELDTNFNSVVERLSTQPWRKLLSVLFVFDQWTQVERVLFAWRDDEQESRVALAWVEGQTLKVKSCSLTSYEIDFGKLKSLSKIAPDKRSNFEIDEFGFHLYWPDYDIHIDIIDAIRIHQDKNYAKQREIDNLISNKRYGLAIAALREKFNLTQREIEEKTHLTERQLRRVEREGHVLSIDVAEKLARAHKMNLKEYLNAVANIVVELKKPKRK